MSFSPNFRGNNAKGSSRQLTTNYQNGTGLTIIQSTPVSTNVSGQMIPVDVTDENSVKRMVGLSGQDVPTTANGPVVDSGRLENVTIGYSVGDILWVSKTGFLINQKPDYGVNGFAAGDFVIFVGVVVQNEFNSLQKDIKLMISLVGQL